MTEQRLKVESGPPQHIIDDAGAAAAGETSSVEHAKQSAKDVADKAQQMTGPVKQKAGEVAGQAKQHARAAAGQAKTRVAAQVDERSTQVGRQLATHAEAIDGVAEELRRQGQEGPAKLAEQAGEKVKSVAGYLQEADADTLVGAASDAAKQNPVAAAAAGAAAGFVAGRVIKAATDDGPADEQTPDTPAGSGS
ncbi:MAG TPA: hypothetical protein VF526_16270 [Solirubrobacteraceae bacterium]|jgi:uncharacterized protein YjbJ (UPF0337 family)